MQIFLEAAHRASLIPMASEAMIYAMKSFGQPIGLAVCAAILGGLAGHGFNWWLGRMLMKLPSSPKHHAMFQKLSAHANRYGFLILVLAPWSLGNVLVTAAGMLGVPLKKTLPVTAAGLFIYYGRLLM